MGCVYSNNEIPKSEVVNEIEKIREMENCDQYEITQNNTNLISTKREISPITFNDQKQKTEKNNSKTFVKYFYDL
jgi:hypothetical protein